MKGFIRAEQDQLMTGNLLLVLWLFVAAGVLVPTIGPALEALIELIFMHY